MVAYPRSAAVTMCLGVGLILRDLHFNQFPNGPADEESSIGDVSSHVAQSVLDWGHYQALLSVCRDACEDIEICLEINSGDTAPKPPTTNREQHGLPAGKRRVLSNQRIALDPTITGKK